MVNLRYQMQGDRTVVSERMERKVVGTWDQRLHGGHGFYRSYQAIARGARASSAHVVVCLRLSGGKGALVLSLHVSHWPEMSVVGDPSIQSVPSLQSRTCSIELKQAFSG